MPSARTIALIAAALACCSAARAGGAAPWTAPTALPLPELSSLALLASALVGLSRFGCRRPPG